MKYSKSLVATKSPGLDGFSIIVYQTYWPSIKKEVIAMVQFFFYTSYLLKELNHTNIVLIPK